MGSDEAIERDSGIAANNAHQTLKEIWQRFHGYKVGNS